MNAPIDSDYPPSAVPGEPHTPTVVVEVVGELPATGADPTVLLGSAGAFLLIGAIFISALWKRLPWNGER